MISDLLKDYRKKHCLSTNEMADKLEVSYVCYIHWENGKTKPNYANARNIAKKLKIRMSDIYD